MPGVELARLEGARAELAHDADHSCVRHANRGLVNSTSTLKLRIDRVERSGEIARILAVGRRVGPGSEHVASRDVATTF